MLRRVNEAWKSGDYADFVRAKLDYGFALSSSF